MQKQEKSCGAVVFREDAGVRLYLILHYAQRHWDLPKGHVEAGESEEQTARREIEEETGIMELEFLPGFRKAIAYSFKRAGGNVPKEVVFFLARTNEKEVTLSGEHIGFEWLACQQALGKITYMNAKRMVQDAESFLSSSKKA